MMENDRPKHPSGRPIRKIDRGVTTYTRRPFDEPLTPGLRKKTHDTTAIGFTANLISEDEDVS